MGYRAPLHAGRLAVAAFAALLLALLALPTGIARADTLGVPVPRGSRAEANRSGSPAPVPATFRSSRSFRHTVSYYQRWLAHRGTRHKAIPVYRIRGVTVTRFLSEARGTKWLAIHVFLEDGKTYVSIVPRPPPSRAGSKSGRSGSS